MADPKKYVLHCSNCPFKRLSDGNDLSDLIEVPRCSPMKGIPKQDKRTLKTVAPKEMRRPKLFKCPRCGYTLKGFRAVSNTPEVDAETVDE